MVAFGCVGCADFAWDFYINFVYRESAGRLGCDASGLGSGAVFGLFVGQLFIEKKILILPKKIFIKKIFKINQILIFEIPFSNA
jgi:hypothetical protein